MTNKYWVTMTDKFMSGWGLAEGKINKYVIECDTYERALYLESKADNKPHMICVNIRHTKPYYNQNYYYTSYRHESEISW